MGLRISGKYTLIYLFVLLCVHQLTEARGQLRVRRNAFQMCNLINRFTGESCLQFNPYGCFCGYGQQGSEPVDEADRCCKRHDDCYGEVHNEGHCYFWSGVFVGYNDECDEFGCRCTDVAKCARKVCECDLALARCLGKATYNQQFQHYDRSQC
ncbi:basic phospholipase A2-like [Mya arenaria]|uniref:basic phospholipase A2-like n=1 Tax=Mya arenaria TaxID=6604 RepID=UPI0022E49890|nr:basic phospholipase A2-like [Mya arenaria]